MQKTVFIQNWEESERGWGTRPDGFTIHVSKEQRDRYITAYYKRHNNANEVPDEYTRASGEAIEIEVSSGLYAKIEKATQLRRSDDNSVIDCIWGKGNSFSTRPMRELKDSDISWPKADGYE